MCLAPFVITLADLVRTSGGAVAAAHVIDEDLLQYDEVCAAAGTPNHTFGITPANLVRVSGGTVCDLAER